ncbi:hypothetical protein D3C80_1401720 [compost metagenome]
MPWRAGAAGAAPVGNGGHAPSHLCRQGQRGSAVRRAGGMRPGDHLGAGAWHRWRLSSAGVDGRGRDAGGVGLRPRLPLSEASSGVGHANPGTRRPADLRAGAGQRATRRALPPSQSHHQRALPRYPGGGGGRTEWLPHHGPLRVGTGARGVRRTRRPAKCAGIGLQQADPAGGQTGLDCGRCHGGTARLGAVGETGESFTRAFA